MICARCDKPFIRNRPSVTVLVNSPLDETPEYVYYHGLCFDALIRETLGVATPAAEYGPVVMRFVNGASR